MKIKNQENQTKLKNTEFDEIHSKKKSKLVNEDGQSTKLHDNEILSTDSYSNNIFGKNVNDESERGWD